MTSAHPLLCALADALEAAAPGEVQLGEFLADQYPGKGGEDPNLTIQFGQMIVRLMEHAVLSMRLSETPVARVVEERPKTSRYARLQMRREGRAPNAYHYCTAVHEPWKRTLFDLLDGERNQTQLVSALAASDAKWEGADESSAGDRERFFAGRVPEALEEFRRKALLV